MQEGKVVRWVTKPTEVIVTKKSKSLDQRFKTNDRNQWQLEAIVFFYFPPCDLLLFASSDTNTCSFFGFPLSQKQRAKERSAETWGWVGDSGGEVGYKSHGMFLMLHITICKLSCKAIQSDMCQASGVITFKTEQCFETNGLKR